MAEVRRASIELGSLTSESIRHFRAVERLSRPYEITVDIGAVEPTFDVVAALGENATLTLEQEELEPRLFAGVVWGVESVSSQRTDTAEAPLRVTIVPAFQTMTLNRTTRIFQGKTVPEILEQVLADGLGAYGRSITNDIAGTYKPREYCVQYQESDFDFVHRLMAEEGIFYSFDFASSPEVMVLHDANTSLTELGDAQLTFSPDERLHRERIVTHFERSHGSRTNAVAVNDWDWTGPRKVEATEERTTALPKLESYEHGHGRTVSISEYDEGVTRYQSENAADQARVRADAALTFADVGIGRSNILEITAGAKFTLAGHPAVGIDDEYIVVEVVHDLDSAVGGVAGRGYGNRFRCIPSAVAFRIPRTHTKPAIRSMQTATVVGPSGEEIHTDPHGRIKVQFHWDREGQNDEHSSCWVRVRQAWAGTGYGFLWLPRIGMEVVVNFLGGDPDRPIVTGCVYNANNTPPYALPGEKTKSTIKSNSSPGGGGFNEYRFEDKSGSEQIYIHAQKDFNEIVLNNHSTKVGGNQTNEVKGNQTQDVGDWQKENIDINQTMTVDIKRDIHVGGAFKENIDAGENRTVTGGSTEKIKSGELRLIVGTLTDDVSGSETRTVHGGKGELIIGTMKRDVTGSARLVADAAYKKIVVGALTVTTPGQMLFQASSGINITAGGPVTANGGPFINRTVTLQKRILKTEKTFGIAKIETYGIKRGIADTKYGFGVIARGATGLKAESVKVKATIAGAKIDRNPLKIDLSAVALALGPNKDQKWAFSVE